MLSNKPDQLANGESEGYTLEFQDSLVIKTRFSNYKFVLAIFHYHLIDLAIDGANY